MSAGGAGQISIGLSLILERQILQLDFLNEQIAVMDGVRKNLLELLQGMMCDLRAKALGPKNVGTSGEAEQKAPLSSSARKLRARRLELHASCTWSGAASSRSLDVQYYDKKEDCLERASGSRINSTSMKHGGLTAAALQTALSKNGYAKPHAKLSYIVVNSAQDPKTSMAAIEAMAELEELCRGLGDFTVAQIQQCPPDMPLMNLALFIRDSREEAMSLTTPSSAETTCLDP